MRILLTTNDEQKARDLVQEEWDAGNRVSLQRRGDRWLVFSSRESGDRVVPFDPQMGSPNSTFRKDHQ